MQNTGRNESQHCLLAVDDERVAGVMTTLKAHDAVHLLGFRTDVSDLLPLFDVYVLPSRMEGLSLALLEAMAASLPVVVTRVGGNPEVVVDGVTGLLVEPGEPAPLAAALGALLDDRPARIALGSRGREHVHERFDMARLVDDHVRLYERLVRR